MLHRRPRVGDILKYKYIWSEEDDLSFYKVLTDDSDILRILNLETNKETSIIWRFKSDNSELNKCITILFQNNPANFFKANRKHKNLMRYYRERKKRRNLFK